MMNEIKKLHMVKVAFVEECMSRIYVKYRKGFTGWNTKRMKASMLATIDAKLKMLYEEPDNEPQKHLVDIANLAMFLWNLERNRVLREEHDYSKCLSCNIRYGGRLCLSRRKDRKKTCY